MRKRQRRKINKFKGHNIHLLKAYDMINGIELKMLWWGTLKKGKCIDLKMYIHKSKRALHTDLNKFGKYINKVIGISKGRTPNLNHLVKSIIL